VTHEKSVEKSGYLDGAAQSGNTRRVLAQGYDPYPLFGVIPLILTPRRMDGEMFEHKPERVLDYFVVVGLDENIVELQDEPFACYVDSVRGAPDPATAAKSAAGAEGYDSALHRVLRTRYRAAVLDRFPAEDHPDTALPPQIAMFALPEGLTVKVRQRAHTHIRETGVYVPAHTYTNPRERHLGAPGQMMGVMLSVRQKMVQR
jgi:hypothetical protein